MKNETVPTGNYFFNRQSLQKCERFLFSLWHSFLLYQQWDALIQLKNLRLTDARQVCRDGLVAFQILRANVATSIKEYWSNPRFRVGVGLVSVAFPLWNVHTYFDVNVRTEGFYYQNWAFFLNEVKSYLCGFFVMLGGFVGMPQKWALRWWTVPFAVLCVTQVYEIYHYDHYLDFRQSMPGWQVWAITLCSVPALFFSVSYLCYRKYHLKDGNLARVDGILNLKNIDAETKVRKLEEMIEERKNYNARV